MRRRNLAKPFALAGFVLAEIYMLFTVLAPLSREPRPLPLPIFEATPAVLGEPVSKGTLALHAAVLSLFFGPFGAVAGTGIGLLLSGLRGDFRGSQNELSSDRTRR